MRTFALIVLLLHAIAQAGISQEWGFVNDQGVRIRKEPTLEGAQIGSLSKGEQVAVVGRTDARMKIGDLEAYWYFIHTEKGLDGWAYGRYIDVDARLVPAIAGSQRGGSAESTVGKGSLMYLGRYVAKEEQGRGSLLLSPDGRYVYAASEYHTSIICLSRNADTGALAFLGQASGPTEGQGLRSIAMSPDGKHVYAAGDRDGTMWWFARDPNRGTLSNCRSVNHPDLRRVTSVALSPDGNHVYAAAWDADAIVAFARNARTGALTPVESFTQAHGEGPNAIAVSPDGSQLWVAAHRERSRIVRLKRDIGTGRLSFVENHLLGISTIRGVVDIAASPDGRNAYVAAAGSGTVSDIYAQMVWVEGVQIECLADDTHLVEARSIDKPFGVSCVAVSPDARNVYAAVPFEGLIGWFACSPPGGGGVGLARGGAEGYAEMDGISDMAVAPDGKHVYVALPRGIAWFRRN